MKKFFRRSLLFKILGIAGGLLLVALIVLYMLAIRFFETGILRPQSSHRAAPEPVVMLDTGDGRKIAAIYRPASDPDAYTILYSYGNLEELAGKYSLLEKFHRRGYGVLGYDYEGFGTSEGEPSLTAALRDAETAYRYLTEECGVPPDRIIAAGFSMGSGPACYLGSRHPLAGVELEGGLASVFQIMIPWSGWPGDPYPNSSRLADCDTPVLIFHGTADKVIPYRNAEKNYREAGGRKRLVPVPGAGHQDILKTLGEDDYFQIFAEFFPRQAR